MGAGAQNAEKVSLKGEKSKGLVAAFYLWPRIVVNSLLSLAVWLIATRCTLCTALANGQQSACINIAVQLPSNCRSIRNTQCSPVDTLPKYELARAG